MLDLLRAAIRGGFKTSEFWLSVLALLLPIVGPIVDKVTGAGATPGAPLWLAVVGAIVAAAYTWARAHVKGKAAMAAADAHSTGVLADLGDVVKSIAAGPVATPAGAIATRPETGGRFDPATLATPGAPLR